MFARIGALHRFGLIPPGALAPRDPDGAASIQRGLKHATQAWARAVGDRYADELDGLWHLSSITGSPLVTLFDRAARVPSFPRRTRVHIGLDDVTADALVALAATQLGYGVLGPS